MLESLITSEARRKLLAVFFGNIGSRFYLRELARKTGRQTNEIGRELAGLEAAGIIKSERQGNTRYFEANKGCPIYSELRGIVLKTEGAAGLLRAELEKWNRVKFAFIYGSVARGEERAKSDIDLFIIGRVPPGKLSGGLRGIEKALGREINYAIYPEEEFIERRKEGFVAAVLKGKKEMVAGEWRELERFAEGRSGQEN
jgi:predicted nucleotidyltransferase